MQQSQHECTTTSTSASEIDAFRLDVESLDQSRSDEELCFPRKSLVDSVTSYLTHWNGITIVAPAGSGVTTVVTQIARKLRERGAEVYLYDFKGATEDEVESTVLAVCERIVEERDFPDPPAEFVRSTLKIPRRSTTYLLIDHLPQLDEYHQDSVCMDLERFANLGVSVLVASQHHVLDEDRLDGYMKLDGEYFSVGFEEAAENRFSLRFTDEDTYHRVTDDLLVLARAYADDLEAGETEFEAGSAYTACVCDSVVEYLRSSALREERLGLLCMLLMESGTYESVKSLVPGIDRVMFEGLGGQFPYLHVDEESRAFRFANRVLPDRAHAKEMLEFDEELWGRCVEHLFKRGDDGRAYRLIRSVFDQGGSLERYSDYLLSAFVYGDSELYAALEKVTGRGGRGLVTRSKCIVDLIDLKKPSLLVVEPRYVSSPVQILSNIDALAQARAGMLGQGFPPMAPQLVNEALVTAHARGDKLSVGMAHLVRGLQCLVAGDAANARFDFSTVGYGDDTVIGVLAHTGRYLCRLLTGDSDADRNVEERNAIHDAMEGLGQDGMASRVRTIMLLAETLMAVGPYDVVTSQETKRLARRDRYIGLMSDLGMALRSLEDACYGQAFKIGQKLMDTCADEPTVLIGLLGHMVASVASACMGERPPEFRQHGMTAVMSPGLDRFDRALSETCRSVRAMDAGVMAVRTRMELEGLPLSPVVRAVLSRVMRVKTPVKRAIVRAMPAAWVADVEIRSQHVLSVPVAEPEPGERPRLRIEILGGTRVYLGGTLLENSAWRRRAALGVLSYLVVAPGHMARRSAVGLEQWPEADYYHVRDNMYATLSCIRKTLGVDADDGTYIVSNCGTLSLNEGMVDCDVDEFLARADEVVRSGSEDERVLKTCEGLMETYHGGVFVPSNDPSGIYAATSVRVRDAYVDALVEGAEAALRLNAPRRAARLAQAAVKVSRTREDCEKALLTALAMDSRYAEAEVAYEEFSANVIAVTHRPPSKDLRRLFEGDVMRAPYRGHPLAPSDERDPDSRGEDGE